jgi:hypothetical protein
MAVALGSNPPLIFFFLDHSGVFFFLTLCKPGFSTTSDSDFFFSLHHVVRHFRVISYAHDGISGGSWMMGVDATYVDDDQLCCSGSRQRRSSSSTNLVSFGRF